MPEVDPISSYFLNSSLIFIVIPIALFTFYVRSYYNGTADVFSRFYHFHVLMYVSIVGLLLVTSLDVFYPSTLLLAVLGVLVEFASSQIPLTLVFVQSVFLFGPGKLGDSFNLMGFQLIRTAFIARITVILSFAQLFFLFPAIQTVTFLGKTLIINVEEILLLFSCVLLLGVWLFVQIMRDSDFELTGDKIPYLVTALLFIVTSGMCLVVSTLVQILRDDGSASSILVSNFFGARFVLPYLWIVSAVVCRQKRILKTFRCAENPVETIDI